MSNIILSTALLTPEDDEAEQVDITVSVKDEDWIGRFDRLGVYRSTTGPSGPFEEITADNWLPPRVPASALDAPSSPVTGALVNIVGTELKLVIFGEPFTVVFTGSDPLTFSQAAGQIVAQGGGLLKSYVDTNGQLVIEALFPGISSTLTVLASDGATLLSLPLTTSYGRDPRPVLTPGQILYSLRDGSGQRDYHYRTRFHSSTTGGQSEPSASSSPKNAVGVSVSNVIVGYLDLVQQDGRALEGAEVHLFNEAVGPLVDGRLVTGQSRVKYTDEAGHIEFQVVRGQKLTLSVQGTTHVRTFTVPTDPTISRFSFFDPSIADEDVFRVSVPEIISAERRTL